MCACETQTVESSTGKRGTPTTHTGLHILCFMGMGGGGRVSQGLCYKSLSLSLTHNCLDQRN